MNPQLKLKKNRNTTLAEKLELLFEIGAEEIPAGMLPRAEEELKVIIDEIARHRKS